MAKVDKITGETIERLRGKVDFYLLRGITPVARRWPKKPKPPYTALQAEAMAVFKIAQSSKKRISNKMLEAWRKNATGKREAWYDTFTKIIMGYWYKNRSIAPIALDYSIKENEIEFWMELSILQLFIDQTTQEEIYEMETLKIVKKDVEKYPKPIYFTLYDEETTRLVAPYILWQV
jgi:hypothetical protein